MGSVRPVPFINESANHLQIGAETTTLARVNARAQLDPPWFMLLIFPFYQPWLHYDWPIDGFYVAVNSARTNPRIPVVDKDARGLSHLPWPLIVHTLYAAPFLHHLLEAQPS